MLRVRDVMTVYPITVRLSQAALDVREGMKLAQIRHIPVLDDQDGLVGIISQRDLLQAMVYAVSRAPEPTGEHPLGGLPIEEVMTRDVKVAHPDDSLASAVGSLIHNRIGCLPVVLGENPRRLVGIITETDALHVLERLLYRDQAIRQETATPQEDPGTA